MPEWKVIRRTFEAFKYPRGSPERIRLNKSSITSEYQRDAPFLVMKDGKPAKAMRTMEECNDLINNPHKYIQHINKYTPEDFSKGIFWSLKKRKHNTYMK